MELFFNEIEKVLSTMKNKIINKNTHRSNVSGLSHIKQYDRDKKLGFKRKIGVPCDSTIFGVVKAMFSKKGVYCNSRQNIKYPELYQAILELGLYILPEDFEYNQICLNKNLKCLPHIDKKNVGDSWIVSFGNFTGGELQIFDENDKIKLYNIKYKPFCFNGSKVKHGTNEFEGTRYSLIFYKY